MELRESELSVDKWVKIWQVCFFLETEKKISNIKNRKNCSSELINRKIVEMIRCRNIE